MPTKNTSLQLFRNYILEVDGNSIACEFTIETGPMIDKLKTVKREKGVEEEIILRMRLKMKLLWWQ